MMLSWVPAKFPVPFRGINEVSKFALKYLNTPLCLSCDTLMVQNPFTKIYEPGGGCMCGKVTFWSSFKWRFRRDIFVTIMRFIVLVIRLMEDAEHVCEKKDECQLVDPVMDCSVETYGQFALACKCKVCGRRVQSKYRSKHDIVGEIYVHVPYVKKRKADDEGEFSFE